MQKISSIVKSSRLLGTTLLQVIQLAWQVSHRLYLAQVILNFISGLLPLGTAFLAGAVVSELAKNLVSHGASMHQLYILVIAFALTQFASNQLNHLESYLDDVYALNFDGYIQEQVLGQFSRLDQTYYDDTEFNNRLNKITQNMFAMRSLSGQSLSLLSSLVQIVATAFALAALQPLLVPVILLALAPVIWIEGNASMKRWRFWDKKGEDFRMTWYLRSKLTDTQAIREIKLYGLTKWLTQRWRTAYEIARRGQISIERQAQSQRAVAGILDAIVQVSIQIWLIALVIGRGVSGLGTFVFYRQVVTNFSSAGSNGLRMLHQMQENSLYVNDYFTFLALRSRLHVAENPITLSGEGAPVITFENVSFKYQKDGS
jgi:ATP-binding cassette subfamily B protein